MFIYWKQQIVRIRSCTWSIFDIFLTPSAKTNGQSALYFSMLAWFDSRGLVLMGSICDIDHVRFWIYILWINVWNCRVLISHLTNEFHVWTRALFIEGLSPIQYDSLLCSSCGLQEEQQAANDKHEAEVYELQHQLGRLHILVERGNQALQQKAQVRNTVDFIYVIF